MTVGDFAQKSGMKIITGGNALNNEVSGVYVCDLLSWVISHSNKGDAWITIHTHLNILAVALMAQVSCIIIPEGINIEPATVKRAIEKDIVILSTEVSAYKVCCKAYEVLENA